MKTATFAIFALATALGGCAASAEEIRTAKGSAYQTDYAIVWNAIESTVRKKYKNIKVVDAAKGVIETDWHLIDKDVDEQNTEYGSRGGMNQRQGTFFRIVVRVVGGPPYKLMVDGEAALFRPNRSMLDPWKHGEAGEPHWVNGRIDAVYLDIHNQLKQYAVPAGTAATAAPAP